jgi:very-short-patch-repair endonuclease
MLKAQKNPSKPEVMLRDMVKELYPSCEFQFGILNYAIDVAIPEYKIAIEFDGWFHFDSEEHKQYHKLRQEKIEKEGWRFLRYTIFDKFPNIEKLKEDINRILK